MLLVQSAQAPLTRVRSVWEEAGRAEEIPSPPSPFDRWPIISWGGE